MKPLYLDHASTTPCREDVWEAMRQYAIFDYGNADSLHSMGRRARAAVDESRERIAAQLGCTANEIIFTSGGTESDNLALLGVAGRTSQKHVITAKTEHLAVLHTCQLLEAQGYDVTYLDVDRYGLINPEDVLAEIRPDTFLVSIAHTNNEIGTIQLLPEISRLVKQQRPDIVFHTDAVQAVGHVDIDVEALGVDLLSFTGQKFYGPKGIGGLYVRKGVDLKPLVGGARKERELESGTLNVPLILGMSLALERACSEIPDEREYWIPLRDEIIRGLLTITDCNLNGHPAQRLPANVSMCFSGVSGDDLVLELDRFGICASTGSACTAGIVEPSHVLLATGLSRRRALGALRLSFGHGCRGLKPAMLVEQISNTVESLRSTSYVTGETYSHSSQMDPVMMMI